MFGLRKRVEKCEREIKEIKCGQKMGHYWWYLGRGTVPWSYRFGCFYCNAKEELCREELSPDQRRWLERLGVLGSELKKAKPTKKGGKK